MKRGLYIAWTLVVCLLLCGQVAYAQIGDESRQADTLTAEGVMQQVIAHAPLHRHAIDEYRADLYLKGTIDVRRKNFLIRVLPTMFRLRKGVRQYMMETYNDLHYSYPDIYEQQVKAMAGTANEFWEADGRLLEFFRLNAYAPTFLYDKLISPLASNALRHYAYQIDSISQVDGVPEYRISFRPKSESFQLVEGELTVSAGSWTLRDMRFAGRSELFVFDVSVSMGQPGQPDELLPTSYEMKTSFRFLGNVIDGAYLAKLDYTDIRPRDPQKTDEDTGKSKYDLSDSYVQTSDNQALVRDSASFDALRPIALTDDERQLYREYYEQRPDTATSQSSNKRSRSLLVLGQVGDALISRYTLDLEKYGSVRTSPLVNPFLVSYSGSNGWSYRLNFKYNRLFNRGRLLRIVPQIGYNFNQKKLYWQIKSDYDYWPAKRSALHVEVGSGNRIYSSKVVDELKSLADTLLDFDRIHLDYFNDLYLNVSHSWEVVNGLTIDAGLSLHHRSETKRTEFVFLATGGNIADDDGVYSPEFESIRDYILNNYHSTYNSIAPSVKITWTPGQYYYLSGGRKINLHSSYPTFSASWERGIKGLFNNSMEYERFELDAQWYISLGLMRKLYLRAGWGRFTQQEGTYFVDFANLRRSNLPTGWADDIGGVFQLLDSRWYNSSTKYLRANAVYESPFLLLRHARSYTRNVLNERLYLNVLVMPHLNPYTELGYGIGTHIFDFGIFASFIDGAYEEMGVKFTFELFNR